MQLAAVACHKRLGPSTIINHMYNIVLVVGHLDISRIIPDPSQLYTEASTKITAPIVAMIAFQGSDPRTATNEMKAIKSSVQSAKRDIHLAEAEALFNQLPPAQQRLLECTREKGASSWVSTLPIDEHKGAFRDVLCLRYGWKLQNLPLHCACGDSLSVDHAMSCHKGGFPTLRHNEICNLTANLLKEVCPNTCIKPGLQSLDGEAFRL